MITGIECDECEKRVGRADHYCRWCGVPLRKPKVAYVVYAHRYDSCEVCAVYLDEEKADAAVDLSNKTGTVAAGAFFSKEVPLTNVPEGFEPYL